MIPKCTQKSKITANRAQMPLIKHSWNWIIHAIWTLALFTRSSWNEYIPYSVLLYLRHSVTTNVHSKVTKQRTSQLSIVKYQSPSCMRESDGLDLGVVWCGVVWSRGGRRAARCGMYFLTNGISYNDFVISFKAFKCLYLNKI